MLKFQPGLRDYVLCGLLYFLGVRIGLDYAVMEEGNAILWLANAALLAPLVLYQGRGYLIFVGIVYLVEVGLSLAYVPLPATLAYSTANVLESTVAFLLMRRWGANPRFRSLSDFTKFFVAGPVLGALCAALLGGYIYTLFNDTPTSYLEFVRVWWYGDGVGLMVAAPLLFEFWPVQGYRPLALPKIRSIDLLIGAVILFGVLMCMGVWDPFDGLFASPGLLLPMMLYLFIKLEYRWVLLLCTGVSLAFVVALANGNLIFGLSSQMDALHVLREFILNLSLVACGISIFLVELRDKQSALSESYAMLNKANASLEQTVAERTRELQQANHKLQVQVATDALTGIMNRSAFFFLLNKEFQRSQRHGNPLVLAMLDLDHFKKINDQYGHLCGDLMLKAASQLIAENIRSSDVVARFGGEEFVLLLPETSLEQAGAVLDRIVAAFQQAAHSYEAHTLRLTLSVGATDLQADDARAEITLNRADMALLQAKEQGRNRVVLLPQT